MNVTTLTIAMAAYSNGRVAAIVLSVFYRSLPYVTLELRLNTNVASIAARYVQPI